MTDKYADLRAALGATEFWNNGNGERFSVDTENWGNAANPVTIRALLAERDELERALTLSGKVSKRLMGELADLVAERDALWQALKTIKEWPVTSPLNMDAHNMQVVAQAALAQGQGENNGATK